VGVHRYPLTGTKKKVVLRDAPPLNWRAMLGDAMTHEIPEPMVEFQLFETGTQACTPACTLLLEGSDCTESITSGAALLPLADARQGAAVHDVLVTDT
jgi:hypothetical protein